MEFLFLTDWTGAESLLLFLCLGVFGLIYSHDLYLFIRRCIDIFVPKKNIQPRVPDSQESPENSSSEFDTVTTPDVPHIIEEVIVESPFLENPEIIEVPVHPLEANKTDISSILGDEKDILIEQSDREIASSEGITESESSTPSVEEMAHEDNISTEPEETPLVINTERETIETEVTPSLGDSEEGTIHLEPGAEGDSTTPESAGTEESIIELSEVIEDIVIESPALVETSFTGDDGQTESFFTSTMEPQVNESTDQKSDLIETDEGTEASPLIETESIIDEFKPIEETRKSIADRESGYIEEDYSLPKSPPQTPPLQPSEPRPQNIPKISSENQEKIYQLVNTIRTLIARGQTLEARGLIIQGLALDKEHRDLNFILGSLFEQDRHFEKAELIYKDLASWYPNDIEILEKLGNILIIQRRYAIAIEIYRKIIDIGGISEAPLYIMTHLASELGNHDEKYTLAKQYLKQWPNNPEILALMAQSEIALNLRQDAIKTLVKLKNLTPYNGEIMETIQKLMMEEEMAGNFGG